MAGFTDTNGRPLFAVMMHKGGKKRVRLTGGGANRNSLAIVSSNIAVVTGHLRALYDGPNGIWVIDLSASQVGEARLTANLNAAVVATLSACQTIEVATLAVCVETPLELPSAATDYGMMVRLFLAESRKPEDPLYERDASRVGMQWMRLILQNRLKKPQDFSAKGAKNLRDIVKAKGQFRGFENYPNIAAGQQQEINDVIKVANDDSHSHQKDMIEFFQNAVSAASNEAISDPSPTELIGWRTKDSMHPGGRFVAFKELAGNQFYRSSIHPDLPICR